MVPTVRSRVVAAALVALTGAVALGLPALSAQAASSDPWWSGGGSFRAPVTVQFPVASAQDVPVETTVDLGGLLTGAGGTGTADPASVRVVEVTGAGQHTGPSLPAQVDGGELTFLAPATGAGTKRFDVYFDTTGAPVPAQTAAAPITLTSEADQGQDAFKVATPSGTWFFQKQGGAFSSVVDAQGADWIGYEPLPNREYRGIPNLADAWYHPGGTEAVTTLVSSGPVKVVIDATGGGNTTRHEIYPGFVRSTITSAGNPYWWLYEGTPGGQITGTEAVLRPSGGAVASTPLSSNVEGDIVPLGDPGAAEWIAFTNGAQSRSIFLAHQDDDQATDGSLGAGTGPDAMTVFGFGRSPAADYPQLSSDNTFTMGLVDSGAGATVRGAVVAATAAPSASVGAAEARPSGTTTSTSTTAPTATSTTAPPIGGAAGSRYTALTPARVLDTRASTKLGPLAPLRVVVHGVAGVPDSATSIVLNATVVEPTQPTFLAVYPTSMGFPGISNLNAEVGDTVPNLVTSPIGTDGGVMVLNGAGTAHVLLDVVGYYAPATDMPSGGGFHAMAPFRAADTRATTPLAPGEARTFDFAGVPGIDPARLRAVALNVTSTGSTTGGYLTVYPAGATRPLASNLNFTAQQTVPNAVVTGVDGAGRAVVYNAQGSTDVILDVVGWYDDGSLGTGLAFHELTPTRVLDTRSGAQLGEGAERTWQRSAPVPDSAKGLAVNVTVTGATGRGYLTVYPGGPRPGVSTQNTSPGLTRANHALTALSGSGQLVAYNSTGVTDLVYDVVGYFG